MCSSQPRVGRDFMDSRKRRGEKGKREVSCWWEAVRSCFWSKEDAPNSSLSAQVPVAFPHCPLWRADTVRTGFLSPTLHSRLPGTF